LFDAIIFRYFRFRLRCRLSSWLYLRFHIFFPSFSGDSAIATIRHADRPAPLQLAATLPPSLSLTFFFDASFFTPFHSNNVTPPLAYADKPSLFRRRCRFSRTMSPRWHGGMKVCAQQVCPSPAPPACHACRLPAFLAFHGRRFAALRAAAVYAAQPLLRVAVLDAAMLRAFSQTRYHRFEARRHACASDA